jgi:hypothetical protein
MPAAMLKQIADVGAAIQVESVAGAVVALFCRNRRTSLHKFSLVR